MKAVGILEYGVEDVFHIFMKNAKKDFTDFNEENPIGCKVEKKIQTATEKQVGCTVEITEYTKNKQYQITSTTKFTNCTSKCVLTYTFTAQKDGTTKMVFEENQSIDKFISYTFVWMQRFLSRRTFKAKVKNVVESLNNELKTYYSNIERSKPKNKAVAE